MEGAGLDENATNFFRRLLPRINGGVISHIPSRWRMQTIIIMRKNGSLVFQYFIMRGRRGHNDGNLKTGNASIRGKAGRPLLTCIILACDTIDTGLALLALEARGMLRRSCEDEKHDYMH